MSLRRQLAIAGLALAGLLACAPGAAARTHSFGGSCEIAGPITPDPGITVIPKPGAHFSFHGTGTCTGSLDGRARRTFRVRLDFIDTAVLFDTCEFGPDFRLRGPLMLRARPDRWVTIPITLSLARAAIVGPLVVRGAGGGLGIGVAQFAPADQREALFQCAGAGGGVTEARLSASLRTLSPLLSG